MALPAPLAPIEALINRNIAASTPARALLGTLAGRSFAVAIGVPGGQPLMRLRLSAAAAGISVSRDEEPADATVSGTPLALAALLAGRAAGESHAPGISVSGQAEVAQAFERLLGLARPDLEEELARLVGDTPAYLAARAARELFGWALRARDSLARDVGEYLTEESRDLVPRAELELLLDGVDRIRDDVDRAEARLALLERRLVRGVSAT